MNDAAAETHCPALNTVCCLCFLSAGQDVIRTLPGLRLVINYSMWSPYTVVMVGELVQLTSTKMYPRCCAMLCPAQQFHQNSYDWESTSRTSDFIGIEMLDK